jgi:membrane dipeptidase
LGGPDLAVDGVVIVGEHGEYPTDLEGGYDLYGDLNLLRALYRLGLRSMQLTAHNTTNAFIDACNDVYTWGGINDHGKAVIKEMNDLGMVINVAHASNDAIIQSVAASRHPVIYSHGGFYKIVDHPRCISDQAATAVAAKGGVIMGLNWLRVIRQVTEAK